jgi:3-oxoacyl-[acyl-carrier-protein] synthase II
MKKRVVVTGMGMVSPLGTGLDKNWQAICSGQSGVGTITRFDPSHMKCKVAAEVKDFDPLDHLDTRFVRRFDPLIQYGLAAAKMAVADAGIKIDPENCYRSGVIIGTGVGAHSYFGSAYELAEGKKYNKVPTFFVINAAINILAGVIAIEFGCRGPHHMLMDACAAGTNSIGMAMKFIQRDEADIMIAGGAESPVNVMLLSSMDALGALASGKNSEPQKASRPFSGDRDGFVAGEGSGMVVLESLDHAVKRGARIYGEVIGYGNNCDAYHYTAPSPNGQVQGECMRQAMKDAGIGPESIDYINAHGTATILNDLAETQAIKSVFGQLAAKVPISSNKSALGHTWGASGALEAIYTLLTITRGTIPPTINLDIPDPQCDLDYVPNKAREAKVEIAMSNSFGFGGINGVLVLKKYSPG